MNSPLFKKGIIIVLLFSIIPFFSVIAFPSNEEDNQFSGYSVTLKQINEILLPGSPVDIFIKDGRAYIVCSSIVVVDISDPNNIPKMVLHGGLASNPNVITFNGNYAYIAQTDGIIKVVNFQNMDVPIPRGSVDAMGPVTRMTVYNGYLYFLRKDFGLHVYDVSVPDFPLVKGNQLVSGDATGLFVRNKYAYVTSSTANLAIIDISDLSTLPIVGRYNSGISFYDVFISDNYAYVPQGLTGVQVLDISKLPNPEHLTNIFTRKFSKQVVVSGYYTWVNDENTIQAFYNKDPKSQLWAGSFDNSGKSINKIEVLDGKYIYLCSYDNKLKVIQIYYNY